MAEISYSNQMFIEGFLNMEGGYVLNFSNRTFRMFIEDAVNIDIDTSKYYDAGESNTSKARRLRNFIKLESNYTVGKLLLAFCDYVKRDTSSYSELNENAYIECKKIAEDLMNSNDIKIIESIKINSNHKDFKSTYDAIKLLIKNDKPEQALGTLHTYFTFYIRSLLNRHSIEYAKEDPLCNIYMQNI